MTSLPPPRFTHRPGLLLGVLALHLLLLGLLASLGAWRDRGAAVPDVPTLLWLRSQPAAPRSAPGSADAPRIGRAPRLPARQPPPRSSEGSPPEPQAITLPSTAANAATTPPDPAPRAATPPALNLDLPRGASAPWRVGHPALDDRHAQTPRATFESRLAAALGGDGTWVEERIDNDRIRFRRGDTCVDVERSLVGRLEPFNNSFSPKPWLAKQPRHCSAR